MVYPDNKNPARFSLGVLHDNLLRNYYRSQLKLIDMTKTGSEKNQRMGSSEKSLRVI